MGNCLYCNSNFVGTTNKKYCSESCRQLAYQKRRKNEANPGHEKREYTVKTVNDVKISRSLQGLEAYDEIYKTELRIQIRLTERLLEELTSQRQILLSLLQMNGRLPARVWCSVAGAVLGHVLANRTEEASQYLWLATIGGGVLGYAVGSEIDKQFEARQTQILPDVYNNLNAINNQISSTNERLSFYINEQKIQKEALVKHVDKLKERIKRPVSEQTRSIDNKLPVSTENVATGLNGGKIITAADLVDMEFKTLKFQGEWVELMGEPSPNFYCMVFGEPKSGKSTFCLKLANYLTGMGPVLYVSSEEGITKTFQHKLKMAGSSAHIHIPEHPNKETLNQDLKAYRFVFIDSANHIGLGSEDLELIRKKNPNTAFVVILQATKAGQFKGGKEFEHNADIIVKVSKGVAYATGRFCTAGEMTIFERPPLVIERPNDRSLF